VDFCIGAHYSRGGRSISMLKSTALDGKASRIVPKFEAGTVIMIPMVYLDYLVTEFGVANLDCKSRRERAEAIISVAHPDFRDELRRAAKEMFYP
jgi:acyl-CoA hydrolase